MAKVDFKFDEIKIHSVERVKNSSMIVTDYSEDLNGFEPVELLNLFSEFEKQLKVRILSHQIIRCIVDQEWRACIWLIHEDNNPPLIPNWLLG